MLGRSVEVKYSAPHIYVSDLAPCQIVSMGIEYGGFITMDLGLIELLNFILLIKFLAFWIPLMVVMYQIVKAMQYIYIYVYLPVKVNERMSLKQSTFYYVENSTPLVGLHTKFYW